jgi:hypothetical protein
VTFQQFEKLSFTFAVKLILQLQKHMPFHAMLLSLWFMVPTFVLTSFCKLHKVYTSSAISFLFLILMGYFFYSGHVYFFCSAQIELGRKYSPFQLSEYY